MQNSTLVCLMSDQALPNLAFVKQFRQENSKYLFISTLKMEGKNASQNLMEALSLSKGDCKIIQVDPDSAENIFAELQKLRINPETSFSVNITGGNKLMSQMAYQFFASQKASIYYSPIESDNYQQLYPTLRSIPKSESTNISLKEYLNAYGFDIVKRGRLDNFQPEPEAIMDMVLQKRSPGEVKIISEAHQNEDEFIRKYLSGDWFEQYCFKLFKNAYGLSNNRIAWGVKLKSKLSSSPNPNDNEFDLMFLHQNDLYIVECKVFLANNVKMDKIGPPMYKLAALGNNLGLRCKKVLAALSDYRPTNDPNSRLDNLQIALGIDKVLLNKDFKEKTGKELLNEDFRSKLNSLLDKFNAKV